jgi:hypothetical protein
MTTNPDVIFLDTSIAIARTVHSPETKLRIRERVSSHELVVSSLVVKQEFKRRLLKEAQYLLGLFHRKKSFVAVQRHLIDVLPPGWHRKRNICLDMIQTVFETAPDGEKTERAMRYLRQLLRVGLSDFTDFLDYVIWQSGCACSHYPIIEKVAYKRYDFGPINCSSVSSRCGIDGFFELHIDAVEFILARLRDIAKNKKSAEIIKIEGFLEAVLNSTRSVHSMDPCLTVGDLVIALESAKVEFFYTMNGKESQHLCRILNQSLIVRPKNPEHEDIVCLSSDHAWREF